MDYTEFVIGANNLTEEDIFRICQAIESLVENENVSFEPLSDGELVLVNNFKI